MRIVIACLVLVTACIKMPGTSRPEVTSGGTWSCQQIVEQCDASCQAPSCLDECTARGTPEAQAQHNAVVSCGQRSFCTNEDCMREHCSAEMQGCTAEVSSPPPPPPT